MNEHLCLQCNLTAIGLIIYGCIEGHIGECLLCHNCFSEFVIRQERGLTECPEKRCYTQIDSFESVYVQDIQPNALKNFTMPVNPT
jgi:hypothetical protein